MENKLIQLESDLAKSTDIIGNMMRDKVAADVVVSNIPIITGESQTNLHQLFLDIANAIKFHETSSLLAIFRLNSKKVTLTNTKVFCPRILLKFNSIFAKKSFMKSYFHHGSLDLRAIGLTTPTRIYCNDSLLSTDAAVFKEALQHKKRGLICAVKIQNGKIFVWLRSNNDVPVHIISIDDLNNLVNK